VEVVVPILNDERSREIMRELAKLNNQAPRVALFDKLCGAGAITEIR
jgi:molecular chaperone DnaJ